MINSFYSFGYFIPTKALIVSLIVIAVLAMCRKAAASKRHVFALTGLASLLLLPFLGLYGPATPVELPQSVAPRIQSLANQRVAAMDISDYTSPGSNYMPRKLPEPPIGPTVEYAIWISGSLLFVRRLGAGLASVARWSRRGEPFQEKNVIRSKRVQVPMTAWVGHPVILLPWDADTWDSERLARILAHERAHIERKDWFWNLAGHVVCAFYWPVPTVWLLQKYSKRAAEEACDDRVLAVGNAPSDYAQDLLQAAEDIRMMPATALPLITKAEVVARIQHILNPSARRGPAGRRVLALCIVGALAVCIPLAGARFRTERFDDLPAYLRERQRRDLLHLSTYRMQFPEVLPPTIPATKENGRIGTLSDGRQVEIVQIQHFTGAGFQVWDADGNPLENTPIYGPTPCNHRRGYIGIVYRLINAPDTPKSLRGTINYYTTEDVKKGIDINYYPEDRPSTSLTVIRATSDGQFSSDGELISDVDFNPGELPAKSKSWLDFNGYGNGGSTLAFRVPSGTILTSAIAFDKENVPHPYRDLVRDPAYPLNLKLYFDVPGPDIDHINVNTDPVYLPVKIEGINFDSILSQVKEVEK